MPECHVGGGIEKLLDEAISDREWAKFRAFGNGRIFQIKATNSSIDSIRLKDGSDMNVPYISRSDINNGVTRFVSERNYSYGYDHGGCITVGLDTQTAFWQPHDFVTGQNIHVVTGQNLNRAVAMFIITILKIQMRAKFNWGGNGATLGRLKSLEILLPVDENGNPDFEYMERYVRERERQMIERYLEYIKGKRKSFHKNFDDLQP